MVLSGGVRCGALWRLSKPTTDRSRGYVAAERFRRPVDAHRHVVARGDERGDVGMGLEQPLSRLRRIVGRQDDAVCHVRRFKKSVFERL